MATGKVIAKEMLEKGFRYVVISDLDIWDIGEEFKNLKSKRDMLVKA